MKKAIKEFAEGLGSLFTGMRITIGQFFKPTVTVHYPHESLKMPPRFRGHIELVRDPETGKPLCFACKLCERACPSDCITVDGAKLEGAKKKSVTAYTLDFTKCSLCGSCVEACRDGAIRFSRDYNLAALSKDEFVMDLFKRLEDEAHQAEKNGELPPGALSATGPAAEKPAEAPAEKPTPTSAVAASRPTPETPAPADRTQRPAPQPQSEVK